MGHIWVLYGQKSPYGAHVGLEWDKCPDSAHMGPTYTCLLGLDKIEISSCVNFLSDKFNILMIVLLLSARLPFARLMCCRCRSVPKDPHHCLIAVDYYCFVLAED